MAWIFFAIFIVVPLLEILAFIQIGSVIGALPTLGMTLLTAVIGALLVRYQGLKVVMKARQSLARDQLPLDAAVHGALLLLAGVMLLTPGFVTDTVGFLLLVPSIRLFIGKRAWGWLKTRVHTRAQATSQTSRKGARPEVIESVAVEIETDERADGRPDESSPWTPRGGTTR